MDSDHPDYLTVIQNIREMRLKNPAPVDTMGCAKSSDQAATPKVQRFQTLISLLLSSQTKDEVTFAAMERLKARGLTPQEMKEIPESELKELLKPVSFFNIKAKNIKKVSEILLESYEGDIPRDVEGLMSLPGIGPKMTYLCMQEAWDTDAGIGKEFNKNYSKSKKNLPLTLTIFPISRSGHSRPPNL